MATLVLSIVGTVVGGPLGGAIGALVGQQVDALIFAPPGQKGPRLKELTVTTSSYGTIIPRHHGRMRVPGSVIWATDLAEHRSRRGGGKGKPKVTTFSYSCSFAVALSSRPILGIGRIWADGNLLRGAAGDFKAGGTLRVHTGEADQLPDPLIAAAEGAEGAQGCPAFRGLAYVVFEDLDLSDFGNRIPTLSFEIFADSGALELQDIVAMEPAAIDARVALPGLAGISLEGPASDLLALLDPIFPMDCDASGTQILISPERLQTAPIPVPEAAVSVGDGDFGGNDGYSRSRSPNPVDPLEILRYYDLDRDYQPGLQRLVGRQGRGQPRAIEIPAACTATDALELATQAARRSAWSRDVIAWRTAEIDPRIGPGTQVTLPGKPGFWRVTDWEWRAGGVELSLSRMPPHAIGQVAQVDPGRALAPLDLAMTPSLLQAFELPWDGTGSSDSPAIFAALSSQGAGWSGASLYADHGDGNLVDLGAATRTRSILGTVLGTLPAANPLLLDRATSLTVTLASPDMTLETQTLRGLAMGGNRALVGREIIQFASAVPLGNGQWRLETLLRGRGGTEAAVHGHGLGEPFILLDDRPLPLDPGALGASSLTMIAALGRGDTSPVLSAIALRGATTRPLMPVHPLAQLLADGALHLRWTRRARGAWQWNDGVDAPLNEQAETYQLGFGPVAMPLAVWEPAEPFQTIPAATVAQLRAALPGGTFHVRQKGTHALSDPLLLATLA